MVSRNSEYFEIKIRYAQLQEDGTQKMVTELYTVDALTFTEAEARITQEFRNTYLSPDAEFKVLSITRAGYGEVITSTEGKDDKWYKTKVAFITLDEKSGKEKRNYATYLCQASSLDDVKTKLNEFLGHTMLDWEKVSVSETKIVDVYFHKLG